MIVLLILVELLFITVLTFLSFLFVLQKENGILDTDNHSDISSGSSSLSDDSSIANGDDKAKVSNVVKETR